jgi:hypothetical protein
MEAAGCSETLLLSTKTTRRYNPEDRNPHIIKILTDDKHKENTILFL